MGCPTCGSPLTLEEFLKSLFRIDASGNVGIMANVILYEDCEALEQAITCGKDIPLDELVRKSCTTNDCDQVMINFFSSNALG